MLYNTDHLLTANIDYFPYMDKCPYKEIDLCQLSVKVIYKMMHFFKTLTKKSYFKVRIDDWTTKR